MEFLSGEEEMAWRVRARKLKEGLPLGPGDERMQWGAMVLHLLDERDLLLGAMSSWSTSELRNEVVRGLADLLGLDPRFPHSGRADELQEFAEWLLDMINEAIWDPIPPVAIPEPEPD